MGGQQVWSRSVEKSEKGPPSKGWRVPWDAECVQGLLLVELVEPVAAVNGPSGPPAAFVKPKVQVPDTDGAERIQLATERVLAAEADVEQAGARKGRKGLAGDHEHEARRDGGGPR